MVAASGDWTKNTLQIEYPAIKSIYRLLGVEDHVSAVLYEAPHNYNQKSREAVYGWLGHWLLGRPTEEPASEKVRVAPPLTEQLVFYEREHPANELNEPGLSQYWIDMARRQLASDQPKSKSELDHLRERFGTALQYSLMAAFPASRQIMSRASSSPIAGARSLTLSRSNAGDQLELIEWPGNKSGTGTVLIVTAGDVQANDDLRNALLKAAQRVVLLKCFPDTKRQLTENERKFFTTYNRTDDANRVQDILTAVAYLRAEYSKAPLTVIARGKAGLDALLARGLLPTIDRMLIDTGQFDNTKDESFLESLPLPGIRRAGDFSTAVAISPLTPLILENTGDKFQTDAIEQVYRNLGRATDIRVSRDSLSTSQILDSLGRN